MKHLVILISLLVTGVLLFASSASAQPTCATVRCAGGGCVDTPGGPVCGVTSPTCASTLCVEGTQCLETGEGPQCVVAKEISWTPWSPRLPNPQACPEYYSPVCAKKTVQCVRTLCPPDIRTFSNSCEAEQDNFTVLYNGQCRSKPMPPNRPQYCPKNYDPVCAQRGAERRTFGNSCEASRKGFYILAHGKCWTQPQPEPWSEPRPEFCPTNYDPVCGRKGRELRTKSNRCAALRDNFEILHSGECR